MEQSDINHRQITIINLLKTLPADLKEIMKRLEEETDKKLVANIRTIQRDFEVIKEMYGITIKYDKYLSKYKIVESDKAPVNERILDFQITNIKFEIATNFRPESFFANCYGILTNQEIEPVEIILSFTFEQGKYIKTLPLHPKQEILVDNNEELQIKLFLKPTYDLEMKLMSFGESMQVLQPEALQKRLVERYQEAIDLYE
jgi:hypothetical protein